MYLIVDSQLDFGAEKKSANGDAEVACWEASHVDALALAVAVVVAAAAVLLQ